jgi:hypothetical protein
MLYNKSPFKAFTRVLHDGLFNQPTNVGELIPPGFIYLIDNGGDQMLSNDGDELTVTN